MELKQKKTIYWSVIITILIIYTLYIFFEINGREKILDSIFRSFFTSFMLLLIPSLIVYRLLFGKITIDKEVYLDGIFIIGFLIFSLILSRVFLQPFFSNFNDFRIKLLNFDEIYVLSEEVEFLFKICLNLIQYSFSFIVFYKTLRY
jgi:hypothetical protein